MDFRFTAGYILTLWMDLTSSIMSYEKNMLGWNFNCCCWGQMSLRGGKDCGHFAVALSNLS